MDQQKQSMEFLIQDGWKHKFLEQKTSSAGLKNGLFPQCRHFYLLAQLFFLWMAITHMGTA